MKKNSADFDRNQLCLIKQALSFYADERNYVEFNSVTPIKLDEYGSQARFAIRLIESLEKNDNEINDEYLKCLKNIKDVDDVKNIINELKKG